MHVNNISRIINIPKCLHKSEFHSYIYEIILRETRVKSCFESFRIELCVSEKPNIVKYT